MLPTYWKKDIYPRLDVFEGLEKHMNKDRPDILLNERIDCPSSQISLIKFIPTQNNRPNS